MDKDRFEKGLQKRKAVLGEEYVNKSLNNANEFNKEFQEYDIIPDGVDEQFKPGFYRQMEAFIELVKKRKLKWPSMDLNDSFKTIELASSFYYA